MFQGDDEDTIAYPMPGLIRTPADTSTPAARRTTFATIATPPDENRLLGDFDELLLGATARPKTEEEPAWRPMGATAQGKIEDETVVKPVRSAARERPGDPMTSTPNLMESVSELLRNRPTPMKPGKFDGTGSLESFLVQFEVCARHNRWTASDKTDYLRC